MFLGSGGDSGGNNSSGNNSSGGHSGRLPSREKEYFGPQNWAKARATVPTHVIQINNLKNSKFPESRSRLFRRHGRREQHDDDPKEEGRAALGRGEGGEGQGGNRGKAEQVMYHHTIVSRKNRFKLNFSLFRSSRSEGKLRKSHKGDMQGNSSSGIINFYFLCKRIREVKSRAENFFSGGGTYECPN